MGLLSGKIALVSGGSMGMGAAHARAIVAEGGRVVIGDVADEMGRALAEQLGEDAFYVHLDVTSEEDWRAAVETAKARYGGLNVLVNNAGILSIGPLGAYTEAQFRRIIDVNLLGVFLGMTSAVETLKACAPSSIINISSVAGGKGGAAFHGYCASKWGVRGLTRSAALELGRDGVRVNTIMPGAIRTPMLENVPERIMNNAFERIGEPQEVTNIVIYLASDLSSFSTGADFIVDGGQLAGDQYREL